MISQTVRMGCLGTRLLLVLPALLALTTARGESLAGKELVAALRHGGYVILMRHASSPRTPPSAAAADAANVQHERQLDETGRDSARAMGQALRRMHIPVGEVLSSPTYRALETARLAGLGHPRISAELGDLGHSMQADATGARGNWLRARASELPASGTNTIIITHFPNIREAFPDDAAGLGDGEALILRPNGHGDVSLIARVKIDEWPPLAAVH